MADYKLAIEEPNGDRWVFVGVTSYLIQISQDTQGVYVHCSNGDIIRGQRLPKAES